MERLDSSVQLNRNLQLLILRLKAINSVISISESSDYSTFEALQIFDNQTALNNANSMMFEIVQSKKIHTDKLISLVQVAGYLAPTNYLLWQQIGSLINQDLASEFSSIEDFQLFFNAWSHYLLFASQINELDVTKDVELFISHFCSISHKFQLRDQIKYLGVCKSL